MVSFEQVRWILCSLHYMTMTGEEPWLPYSCVSMLVLGTGSQKDTGRIGSHRYTIITFHLQMVCWCSSSKLINNRSLYTHLLASSH